MIPNYSNWIAKRVWAVNQTRAGHSESEIERDNESSVHRPSFHELEWEARKQDEAWEREQQRQRDKIQNEWFEDKSPVQQERDYEYLRLVLSGDIIENLNTSDYDVFESEWRMVMSRINDICEKFQIDLEAYARKNFPNLYN